VTEQATRDLPQPEPEKRYRTPSQEARCAPGGRRCDHPPVADIFRGSYRPRWYGICADHLRRLNREVRDGRVWWLGYPEGEG
jgi:hypothetical protein